MEETQRQQLLSALSLLPHRLDLDVNESTGCDSPGPLPFESLLTEWEQLGASARALGCSGGWTPPQAEAGLVVLESMQRSIDALRVRLTIALGSGRDTAARLARSTRMPVADARRLAAAAQVAERVASAHELLASGDISTAHLGALVGVEADDAAGLLAHAASQTVEEFRKTVAQHQIKHDNATREERQHAARRLRFFTGDHGSVGFSGQLPAVAGNELKGLLEALAEQRYQHEHPTRARVAHATQTNNQEQRLADALASLAHRPTGNPMGGSHSRKTKGAWRPTVVAVVDLDSLTAEVLPGTPISAAEAAVLVARAELFVAIREHTTPITIDFGRNKRLASAMQKLLLAVMHQTCVVEGCQVPATRSDVHHRVEWDVGGRTDLQNLVPLCDPHHAHLHLTKSVLTRSLSDPAKFVFRSASHNGQEGDEPP